MSDIRRILEKMDSMTQAAKKPTGPKFPGYWKGTDSAELSRERMVGSAEESDQSIIKDLHKNAKEKVTEWQLEESYKNFKEQEQAPQPGWLDRTLNKIAGQDISKTTSAQPTKQPTPSTTTSTDTQTEPQPGWLDRTLNKIAGQDISKVTSTPQSLAPAAPAQPSPPPTPTAQPTPSAKAAAEPSKPVDQQELMKQVQQVAKASGISNPDLIYPGQKIKLPGGEEYTVAKGDTLSGILTGTRKGYSGAGAGRGQTGGPTAAELAAAGKATVTTGSSEPEPASATAQPASTQKPDVSGTSNPWANDSAKSAAWNKLTPEQKKWMGGADPTDPYILQRMRKAVPDSGPAPSDVVKIIDSGKGYNVVQRADGSVEKQVGTRAWRNNNPGNIEFGPYAKSMGAIGSDGRFAIFPSLEQGRAAKEALLFGTKSYKDLDLMGAISRYAPPNENQTQAYQKAVLDAVGGVNKKMSEYTPQERQAILSTMRRIEGFSPGRTTRIAAEGTEAFAEDFKNYINETGQIQSESFRKVLDKVSKNKQVKEFQNRQDPNSQITSPPDPDATKSSQFTADMDVVGDDEHETTMEAGEAGTQDPNTQATSPTAQATSPTGAKTPAQVKAVKDQTVDLATAKTTALSLKSALGPEVDANAVASGIAKMNDGKPVDSKEAGAVSALTPLISKAAEMPQTSAQLANALRTASTLAKRGA